MGMKTLRRASRAANIIRASIRQPSLVLTGAVSRLNLYGRVGNLPTAYAFALFPGAGSCEITLQGLDSRLGGVTLSELAIISAIARTTEPKAVFEMGTADGRTTLNLALNAPDDCCIYTLDLPVDQRCTFYDKLVRAGRVPEQDRPTVTFRPVGGYFKEHTLARKITQLYGDSKEFDFSPYYHKIDLVFIDANHDYDYVKSDTVHALQMLSENGTIIWHDYPNGLGVTDCLSELRQELSLCHLWETTLACYARSSLATIHQ